MQDKSFTLGPADCLSDVSEFATPIATSWSVSPKGAVQLQVEDILLQIICLPHASGADLDLPQTQLPLLWVWGSREGPYGNKVGAFKYLFVNLSRICVYNWSLEAY